MVNIVGTGNTIGKGLSILHTITGSAVGLCCISSGIISIVSSTKLKKYNEVQGKITNIDSCSIVDKEDDKYTCSNIHYEFTIDTKTFNGTQSSYKTSRILNKGEFITIHYDPENPEDNNLDGSPPMFLIGGGMISFGLCIIISVVVMYYIIKNVKGAGTGYAATQALSAFSR